MEFENTSKDLMRFAYELLGKMKVFGKPVFVCVGSDKFVCDSLAPIVAEILKCEYNIPCYVYGGLDYNINAHNLIEAINYVETVHPKDYIVLIDATLGDNVGKVELKEGCIAGLGQVLPIRKIGRTSVLGVVGRRGRDFNLNSTRLKVVMDMARFIANGCYLSVMKLMEIEKDKKIQNSTNVI